MIGGDDNCGCFNTQPPEGGCFFTLSVIALTPRFNTQPPEGGCIQKRRLKFDGNVSTHSRPKAAAQVPAIANLM